jgi:alanine racemase
MDKRVWAVVNLDLLKNNIRELKKLLPPEVGILAVVKANAYGHGAKEVTKILKEEKITMVGVASVEEAEELKEEAIKIIILSPTSTTNIPHIIENNFIPSVSTLSFAETLNLEAKMRNKKVLIHIEIDTGMTRTGVKWTSGVEFVEKISKMRNLKIEGIFTHLSQPEEENDEFTFTQLKRFERVIKTLKRKKIEIPYVHTASTGAVINYRESYFNMVRPGIFLYGIPPNNKWKEGLKVSPILSVYTRVCAIYSVPKGTGISYGKTYVTQKKEKIATLSVGYGDGYPRSLSNRGKVILKGKIVPVVGRVCMDLTMIKVTDIPGVKIDDVVVLIGKDGEASVSVQEIANLANTSQYEIITRISPRVPMIYIKNGKVWKIKTLLKEKEVKWQKEKKYLLLPSHL